ncbi:transposase [Actinomadura sp. NPDC048032]|uniref:transposase n=1 Tax=Actinomadura sp. NPDC048032 TaxID=3155747 RepID=UPI0033CCE522
MLQAALEAEMTEHLGCERGANARAGANHRHGNSPKTVPTEVEPVRIEVPQDPADEFKPQIVLKHARRVAGFNESITALYLDQAQPAAAIAESERADKLLKAASAAFAAGLDRPGPDDALEMIGRPRERFGNLRSVRIGSPAGSRDYEAVTGTHEIRPGTTRVERGASHLHKRPDYVVVSRWEPDCGGSRNWLPKVSAENPGGDRLSTLGPWTRRCRAVCGCRRCVRRGGLGG